MINTVADLIKALQQCDPNALVRYPGAPFDYAIEEIASGMVEGDLGDEYRVVYVKRGDQLPYLPSAASEVFG